MLSVHFTVVTGGENTYVPELRNRQPWGSWTNGSHCAAQAAESLCKGRVPALLWAALEFQMLPETPTGAIVHASELIKFIADSSPASASRPSCSDQQVGGESKLTGN